MQGLEGCCEEHRPSLEGTGELRPALHMGGMGSALCASQASTRVSPHSHSPSLGSRQTASLLFLKQSEP